MKKALGPLILAGLLIATPVLSQANTGKITGRVTAEDGTGLPGVLVTATSPALQGERSTVTTGNGDYTMPQLPAGNYSLGFELDGFAPIRQDVKVSVSQTVPNDQQLALSEVTEEIIVTSETSTISRDIQSQTTYEKDMIESLAITRGIEDTVVLAPGVHATGPKRDGSINGSSISISGSQSYENVFMVNGVVVNENTRGQALEFVIEDAIQETTVSSSGISAEYGRFNGGVINVITKSGGNQLHGSVRANVTQENWQGKNPLSAEELDDTTNKIYEATLGGRILRDKLWFFLAARDLEIAQTDVLQQTLFPLSQDIARDRAEAKLTFSPTAGHRIIGAYQERNVSVANDHFSAVDLSTVNPLVVDVHDLISINYTGVITANFFLEGQYSERTLNLGAGEGGKTTDRIGGTWLLDLANFSFLNSPVFCAVCTETQRDNDNTILKGSYFLSTKNRGTHDFVFGYDDFTDINVRENHQSASDYHVWSLDANIVRGQDVFPVVTHNGYNRLRWTPVLEATQGMQFATTSIFANDTWRLGTKTSLSLGVRYDENDSNNASGEVISDDKKISPRLGFAYDLKGDGDTVLNATYGHYASSINTGANIGSATGSAGALGSWIWLYGGPEINPDPNAANLLNAEQALQVIFAWFDSVGGNDNVADRLSLNIPGLGLQVRESITTPSAEEFTVGVVKRLGSKGLVRADLVFREFGDFYARRTDTGTGHVTNPDGSLSDLTLFINEDSITKRKYTGLHTQFSYRINDRLSLAGNWSFSKARGNFNGETQGNAALPTGVLNYPELKAFDRNLQSGDLELDQRHKAALWAIYNVLQRDHHHMSVSVLQRFASGRPYGTDLQGSFGAVDSRPYVDLAGLGYEEAPSNVSYWFYDRDQFRTDDITSTDLALNYGFRFKGLGKEFEVFFQPEVLNVFNEDSAQFVDGSILDATSGGYAAFNPFTDTPVEGVHYDKGPDFGQPQNAGDYQPPRTFRFSVGFRF